MSIEVYRSGNRVRNDEWRRALENSPSSFDELEPRSFGFRRGRLQRRDRLPSRISKCSQGGGLNYRCRSCIHSRRREISELVKRREKSSLCEIIGDDFRARSQRRLYIRRHLHTTFATAFFARSPAAIKTPGSKCWYTKLSQRSARQSRRLQFSRPLLAVSRLSLIAFRKFKRIGREARVHLAEWDAVLRTRWTRK